MSTSFYGVDIVDIGTDLLRKSRIVLHCNLNRDDFAGLKANNRTDGLIARNRIHIFDVLLESFFGIEFFGTRMNGIHILLASVFFRLAQICEGQLDTLVQECQFTQSVSESLVAVERSNSEDFSIRMEGDSSTCVVCFSHNVDRCKRLALGELLNEDFSFPMHLGAEIVGKRVHAADTHTVQTS